MQPVADWSQAEVRYTRLLILLLGCRVADWSQAEVRYTRLLILLLGCRVADWSQAEVRYTWVNRKRIARFRCGLVAG